jgi:alpha-amylase
LIEAERELDSIEGITGGTISIVDYDLDGADEALYESPVMNAYIAPSRGGAIIEMDYKPVPYNLCDLLQRRPEGYHLRLAEAAEKREHPHVTEPAAAGRSGDLSPGSSSGPAHSSSAKQSPAVQSNAAEEGGQTRPRSIHDELKVKEAGLEKALRYDSYRHAMLVDHFYGHNVHAAALREGSLEEHGDFFNGEYQVEQTRGDHGTHNIILTRNGRVGRQPVAIRKEITFHDSSARMDVAYAIRAIDGRPIHGRFGIEMAYTLSAGTEPDRYYLLDGARPDGASGMLNSLGEGIATRYALVDEWLRLRISVVLERPAFLMRAPVETVSLSESGMERIYQGSLVVAMWELEGARDWGITFRQEVERL